jgi:hypothetical protein
VIALLAIIPARLLPGPPTDSGAETKRRQYPEASG